MCRLAAYLGPEIRLERIIVGPSHSLLQQSQFATEAKLAVNGDGFGIAWYGKDDTPGLYRDVLPAWSDGNLMSICRMVSSPLFLAHVRASTVGETSRTNCHPFTHGNWSFMHNGQIPEFGRIRRQLEATLPDDLYHARRGTTDSELLFLLALAAGLDDDPKGAIERAITVIHEAQGEVSKPNRITCVFSNGDALFGFRHSSDLQSPTLYASGLLRAEGRSIASEPLDGDPENWNSVEEGQFLTLNGDGIELETLEI
jgi:glutamine amidotransferase